MSSISIQRKHTKSLKDARAAVIKVATAIEKKFSIHYEWDGDVLHFSRSGVDGRITLTKGLVEVDVRLGFLLMALRGPVTAEIERVLEQEFT